MERQRLQSMSVEQLWQLHTMINDILAGRLIAKKQELQRRLKLLNPEDNTSQPRVRRQHQARALLEERSPRR